MAKYKIVATGPMSFDEGIERLWIGAASPGVRIISIAGVPWKDIPEMGLRGYLGRYRLRVAVRSDLQESDFEVEIIDG